VITTPAQAREAARAFGHFQAMLADLPAPRLEETIPRFHHTPSRFATLIAALETDACHRARDVKREIDFVTQREPVTRHLLDLHQAGRIPERITHNDTKINNVMMDPDTNEGMCVIDLDTVMPGLALYDFGDMVRTATSPAPEDERDLSKVTMRMEIFEALAEGYLAAAGSVLNPAEIDHLAYSSKLIALETGIRFLTDHLGGDTYFKIHRPNHNLDRARTQFKLVESIEAQEEQMKKSVTAILTTR
jgi:Ser/Thr protein kinase RdoA (MazF antagonist)